MYILYSNKERGDLMNEEEINDDGFYMKINSELKKQFNIKCIENKTTMSNVLKEYMKEYIEN